MKKYFFVLILFSIFMMTNVCALDNMTDLWYSNDLKIDNSSDTVVKELMKKDNVYYVFKEYKKDNNDYFTIQLIDGNKEVIKYVELMFNVYDYRIVNDGILIAIFINDGGKKEIQLYKYDFEMNLLKSKTYDYIDSRKLVDKEILITDSYILYGFYYSVNHGQFVVNKYDYDFELSKSIDEEPENNGNTTKNRDIIKSQDSLVFINKTEHYKATCLSASKVGQNMKSKTQTYCKPTSYGKITNYYCGLDKCMIVYKKSGSKSLTYYNYDSETHKFYDVGTYSISEVNQDLFIKKYSYNSKNELCNNAYCKVVNLNNNMYAFVNYSSNKSIKIYDRNNNNVYKSSYVDVEDLLVKSNLNRIVIRADQKDKSYLYLLDMSGNLISQYSKSNVEFASLSDVNLLIYTIENNQEILYESTKVENVEIKQNNYGIVEKEVEIIEGQVKIKITINPKDGYEFKEVKVTNLEGETRVIDDLSFYLNNEAVIIEPIYFKIEKNNKLVYLPIAIAILVLSVLGFLFFCFSKPKRYAD